MLPILYSFRRCPYAIRARLALVYSGEKVELREVLLKDKPQELVGISSKATVPVLLLPNGKVIDESRDIMNWVLSHNDPYYLLPDKTLSEAPLALVDENDIEFKYYLDRYKYADRYPEQSKESYRAKAEKFIEKLDSRLASELFLFGSRITYADIAILPFVRQFAHVDLAWFESTPYRSLRRWLFEYLDSAIFLSVMEKYPRWESQNKAVIFSSPVFADQSKNSG